MTAGLGTGRDVDRISGTAVATALDAGPTEEAPADTTARMAAVGRRLRVGVEDLLTALEDVMDPGPPGGDDPQSQLSEHDQAVLREAGMLRAPIAGASPASTRATIRYARLRARGLTVKEAAARLEVSEARIRQRLADRSLYGFQTGQGWCLPDFQFVAEGELPGIKHVVQALPSRLHPLSVEGFFLRPKPELVLDDQSVGVVDWLGAGGDPEPVVQLAADLLVT